MLLSVAFYALLVGVLTKVSALSDAALNNVEVDRCTTIAVSAAASTTGGPMNTHTADCADCDFRINKVPARDWPANSLRPLYRYKGNYPSTITPNRGLTWHPDNLEGTKEQIEAWGKESEITGYIPQVPHTYALYEAGYGIMNEHQVAIGESTCAAKLWAAPTIAGGKARIEVREMSQIALERTKTAREAIQLMGDLATSLGFYAADWSGGDLSKGEGGEALTVVDTKEAWVFHVGADDTGASAIWVAQRVEPGHVSAVANQFVIRHVDPKSDKFMYSSNLWEVAKRAGFWKEEDGLLDFLTVYAPQRAHSPYATRRVWRVFNLVAPSLILPPNTDGYGTDYPFSVKAERLLSPQDIMDIQRDHYEGTVFDLTQGIAAGPYGDPNRFDMAAVDNMTFIESLSGSYERAISLFRTSYSFVSQPRPNVPDILSLLWFSQYAPSSTSYAPFYIAATQPPKAYTKGSLFHYDNTVSFWNFAAAGNYASRFYKFAMQDVFALQKQLMSEHLAAMTGVEETVLQLLQSTTSNKDASIVELLTTFTHSQGEKIVSAWRDLLPQLITKYHDGYAAEALTAPAIHMKKLFYPKFWLQATGYFANPPTQGEGVIMFQPNPTTSTTTTTASQYILRSEAVMQMIWTVFFTAIIVGTGSWFVFTRMYADKLMGVTIKRSEYTPIPV